MIKLSSEWKPINPDNFALIGTDYTIEDRTNGMLYVTSKAYMNKLLDVMGYRNVNVLKILDEFAGKIVSDIGKIDGYKIYVNNVTSSFIFLSDKAYEWYEKFTDLEFLDKVELTPRDNVLSWSQIIPKTENGFAFYVDMIWEYVNVLSYHRTEEGLIVGMQSEGAYNMKEEESIDVLSSVVSLGESASVRPDYENPVTALSIEETMTLLAKLGYAKKNRRGYYMTGKVSPLIAEENLVIKYNSNKWIARRILQGIQLKTAYTLISSEPDINLWDFNYLYTDAAMENLDCDNSKF